MLDTRLRGIKDRSFDPLVRALGPTVHPHFITVLGLGAGVVAFAFSLAGRYGWALGAWGFNRLMDGLDGPQARRYGRVSELGGYFDLLADFLIYALLPLGLALSRPADEAVLAPLAIMLVTFYVNAASWMLLSRILERRGRIQSPSSARTEATEPIGLVEGTETAILFTLFLVFPEYLSVLFWLTAALVSITAAQRILWAARHLA